VHSDLLHKYAYYIGRANTLISRRSLLQKHSRGLHPVKTSADLPGVGGTAGGD